MAAMFAGIAAGKNKLLDMIGASHESATVEVEAKWAGASPKTQSETFREVAGMMRADRDIRERVVGRVIRAKGVNDTFLRAFAAGTGALGVAGPVRARCVVAPGTTDVMRRFYEASREAELAGVPHRFMSSDVAVDRKVRLVCVCVRVCVCACVRLPARARACACVYTCACACVRACVWTRCILRVCFVCEFLNAPCDVSLGRLAHAGRRGARAVWGARTHGRVPEQDRDGCRPATRDSVGIRGCGRRVPRTS